MESRDKVNHCEDSINYIKTIKDHLAHNKYHSGEELEQAFDTAMKRNGVTTNGVSYDNLDEVFCLQEFLIHEVCKLHERENDLVNERLFRENISIKVINKQLQDGKRAFDIYAFNECGYEYFLIGDIHSDTISLKRILRISDFFCNVIEQRKVRLIFLGDYVDRGKAHIKTLEYILALKFLFPEHLFLLKGNHDAGILVEDKIQLCIRKPEGESEEDYFLLYLDNLLKGHEGRIPILKAYLRFFDSLCNIAFVNNQGVSILAVHGGIPRPRKDASSYYGYLKSISDLTNVQIMDHMNKDICSNMRWSDPYDDEDDLRENLGRFRFTAAHFDEFQRSLQFDLLIRGHEAEAEGYKRFFDDRLTTIFSSGAVLEDNINVNNETAYGGVAAKIMKFSVNGEVSLLDLNGSAI